MREQTTIVMNGGKRVNYTVKPVYNGHSKMDKTNILMTTGCLMKVNTFDLH